MKHCITWVGVVLLGLAGLGCSENAPTQQQEPEPEVEEKRFVVNQQVYTSTVQDGTSRPLTIILPSDYDALVGDLPVLYLLHGWGGNELDWVNTGRARLTLSEYYERGEVVPMIVVMPNNIIDERALTDGPDVDLFLQEIREDIIPFIERTYRVSTRREDRAIAGLSAGGIQTLNLTLFYPELWCYSFPMSTAYFPDALPRLREEYADALQDPAINELAAFELGIGTEDFLFYDQNIAMREIFDELGIQYAYFETPGGHTWDFWSSYFERIAPLLFK